MNGRTEWTDGRTDDAKTISLRLHRGIKRGHMRSGPGVIKHFKMLNSTEQEIYSPHRSLLLLKRVYQSILKDAQESEAPKVHTIRINTFEYKSNEHKLRLSETGGCMKEYPQLLGICFTLIALTEEER